MMKYIRKFTIALLLILLIGNLSSQIDSTKNIHQIKKLSKFYISAGGGFDLPSLHGYKKGFGIQFNAGYQFNNQIGIRAEINSDFIGREDQILHNPDGITEKVTGGNMKLFTVNAEVMYGSFDSNEPLNAYILMGIGWRNCNNSERTYEQTYFSYFTNSDTTKKTDQSAYWDSKFAASVGTGIRVKLNAGFKVYGELQYSILNGLALNEGILNGCYISIRLGVLYLL